MAIISILMTWKYLFIAFNERVAFQKVHVFNYELQIHGVDKPEGSELI